MDSGDGGGGGEVHNPSSFGCHLFTDDDDHNHNDDGENDGARHRAPDHISAPVQRKWRYEYHPLILLPEIAVQSIIQKRIFLSNTPLCDPII